MTEVSKPREDSRARGRVLRAIVLVSAPLAFFAFFELALMVVGFGGRHALFVESRDMAGMLEPNSRAIQRHFPGRETKLGIDPITFRARKSDEGVRIVVQGGSTAAGFPYGRWAGLAGMLGDRLEAAYPDREIEVISTAMAAVNSYTLLDFVDEIIEIEPDVVLIYAGHNEFLGILGAGSALTSQRSRAATLLHLELSRFRVYQLMEVLLSAVKGLRGGSGSVQGAAPGTLMALAATSAEIPVGSGTYREGLLQFEGNLRLMLEKYRKAEIPVMVGTLVSNERNQSPFAGGVVGELVAARSEELFRQVREHRTAGNLAAARGTLEELLALDSAAADTWFSLAQVEQSAGNATAARNAYREAKEHDRLRFRAPEAFNETIRRLAEEFGTTVVEVQAHFARRAPMGVVGEELMLEHLHPNAEGYFLLADAYYDALERRRTFGRPARSPTRDEAMRDMPITAVDRVLAAQVVREIRGEFPFRAERIEAPFPQPRNPIEAIAKRLYEHETTWLSAMESLLQHLLRAGQVRDAGVVARVTAQALPWERAPNFAAGSLLLKLGHHRRALKYLERSLEADPDDSAALPLIIRSRLLLGEEEGARAALARLEAVDPTHAAVQDFEGWRKRQLGSVQTSPVDAR